MKPNRSNAAPPRAESFQRLHEARLTTKIENNKAIAEAHQRSKGPRITASMETQPAPRRPRIRVS